MAFKLKPFNMLLNLHPSSNKLDNVIKLVDAPKKVWGYIDENKTIHVNKDITPKQMARTIAHEQVHKKQMNEGRLEFSSLTYKWRPKRGGKQYVIPTKFINTKSRKLPWEVEAEKKG